MQTKTALTVAKYIGKVGFLGTAYAGSARPNLMKDKCFLRQCCDVAFLLTVFQGEVYKSKVNTLL
jgi:hypothetical protein